MKKNIPNSQFPIPNSQNGFTLIELLASLFIMVMLTGLFLANYHSSNNASKVSTAAQELASNIRLAQGYALGSKEFSGSISPGGWGIYFNTASSSYAIFADINEDQNYNDPAEKFSEISLPTNVTISSVSVGSDVDIVFLPPDPITYINTDPAASVQIGISDGETSKTVEVNYLGLVDMID